MEKKRKKNKQTKNERKETFELKKTQKILVKESLFFFIPDA